jgi:hypothetical protein
VSFLFLTQLFYSLFLDTLPTIVPGDEDDSLFPAAMGAPVIPSVSLNDATLLK